MKFGRFEIVISVVGQSPSRPSGVVCGPMTDTDKRTIAAKVVAFVGSGKNDKAPKRVFNTHVDDTRNKGVKFNVTYFRQQRLTTLLFRKRRIQIWKCECLPRRNSKF